MLDPGRRKTRTGWFWTIARDDRPWGAADPPAVVAFCWSYARRQFYDLATGGALRLKAAK